MTRDFTSGDLVFTFSFVTWDGAGERGMAFPEDRLVCRLLAESGVPRLVVANAYRSAARRAARAVARRAHPFPQTKHRRLVSPIRVRRDDSAVPRRLERQYAAYDRALRRAAARADLRQPAVITASPLVAGYAPLSWAGPVTYYATDDWAVHPAYAPISGAVLDAYTRLRARGHRVCAVSSTLLERLAPTGPALVLPNGLEPAEWGSTDPPPSWFARLPRPRMLYAGTLDSRLDEVLLEELAARFRNGSLVLVGPPAEGMPLERLRRMPNVHVRPTLSRQELRATVASADVGLLPHRVTELTQAMSPLKLYEYLAAGLPVASVDLPGVRAAASTRIVRVAAGEDFADGVGRALAAGRATPEERASFARRHSWERRHDELLSFALQP